MATSDYGAEIQKNLNAVVGHNEKITNSIVRHTLDLKNDAISRNPNPLNVTFYDMKKFDQVNQVTGKLTAQVKASKLTKQEVNQKLLDNFEADQIQVRLDKLKYEGLNDSDNDDNKKGPGGTPSGTPIKVQTIDDDENYNKGLIIFVETSLLSQNNKTPQNKILT